VLSMFIIVVSIVPLCLKEPSAGWIEIERVCVTVFIIDYILRWITADYKLGIQGIRAFLRIPFRIISIVDLLSIFALTCSALDIFSGFQFTKILAVCRIIRIFRYSKSARTIIEIFQKSKKQLLAVVSLALGYIVVSSIIIYNVEPQSFNNFFEAVYWATVSLTTVGYGDLYPVTDLGRIVAMASSFCGIAIVALPAGIVTAEYIKTLNVNCDD
jgi:voltage-gated potassium channel